MKSEFDNILENYTEEEQQHWQNHLHYINARSTELDNWIGEAINGKIGFSIDCFQRIREIGYLGNPANFTGTYLSYLAHEAHYFNYELDVFTSSNESTFDEVVIFDEDIYTGGWASTISQEVSLPSDIALDNYSKMEVELLRGCPDADGNYSDAGCDEYDRIAH